MCQKALPSTGASREQVSAPLISPPAASPDPGTVAADGSLSFSHTLAEDLSTEGDETLSIQLFSDSNRTQPIGTAASVLVNDTSITPNSDTLLITVPGSGSLNDAPFSNTYSFNLDIGDDTIRLDEAFTHPALSATPLPEMTVDAGGDNDTFYGNSSDNILILTGINQGSLDGITFSNVENVDLLGGNNTVYIRPGGQLTGTLNGGSSTFILPDPIPDPTPKPTPDPIPDPVPFPIPPTPSPNPVEGGFNAFFLNDNPNTLNLTGAGSGNIDGTSFVNFAAVDMRGGQDTANIAA
jgi:hypothetical protein